MAGEFVMRTEGFDKLQRNLADPSTVNEPVRLMLDRSRQLVFTEVTRRTPVRTGRLKGGIASGLDAGPKPRKAAVATTVKHGKYMEFGTIYGFDRRALSAEVDAKIRGKRKVKDRRALLVKAGATKYRVKPRRMFKRGLAASRKMIQQFAAEAGLQISARLTRG